METEQKTLSPSTINVRRVTWSRPQNRVHVMSPARSLEIWVKLQLVNYMRRKSPNSQKLQELCDIERKCSFHLSTQIFNLYNIELILKVTYSIYWVWANMCY